MKNPQHTKADESARLAKIACAKYNKPILIYECIDQILDSCTVNGHLNWSEAKQKLSDNRNKLIAFLKLEAETNTGTIHLLADSRLYKNLDF
jgi:hypothetical protein